MRIPARQECLRMLKAMAMPLHIQNHSRMVCRVALFLCDGLAGSGVVVNRDLVRAAALLHDITKPRSFTTGENHALTGGQYLSRLGFPEVGEIVRQHVILDSYFAGKLPNEAELVNYSDKRVLHDSIVSLDDRMDYIVKRYATTAALQRKARRVWRDSLALEKRIFSYLPIEPDQLSESLAVTPYAKSH